MEEHYVNSFDQTRIYYQSYGQGPAICACNGIGVSTFFWKYLVQYFEKTNRVILWDYRSHGKSAPAPDYGNLTMATNARDLLSVLDDAKVSQAVLLGHSMGVQTIFEFYRLFPDRVAGLIPVLGSYGHPMDTFLGTSLVKYVFPFGYHLVNVFPGMSQVFTQMLMKGLFHPKVAYPGGKLIRFINSQHCSKEDLIPYLRHLQSLDVRAFMNMAKGMQEHSAKDLLPGISVPVLIISGENDLFTPWEISNEMHQLIPGAELLTIPRGSHAALVEQPELMNLRIEKFFREKLQGSPWSKDSGNKPKSVAARKKTKPSRPSARP